MLPVLPVRLAFVMEPGPRVAAPVTMRDRGCLTVDVRLREVLP